MYLWAILKIKKSRKILKDANDNEIINSSVFHKTFNLYHAIHKLRIKIKCKLTTTLFGKMIIIFCANYLRKMLNRVIWNRLSTFLLLLFFFCCNVLKNLSNYWLVDKVQKVEENKYFWYFLNILWKLEKCHTNILVFELFCAIWRIIERLVIWNYESVACCLC